MARPPITDGSKLVFKTIGLTAAQWEWLKLWHEHGSPTDQVREMMQRAEKFWPAGPAKFR